MENRGGWNQGQRGQPHPDKVTGLWTQQGQHGMYLQVVLKPHDVQKMLAMLQQGNSVIHLYLSKGVTLYGLDQVDPRLPVANLYLRQARKQNEQGQAFGYAQQQAAPPQQGYQQPQQQRQDPF